MASLRKIIHIDMDAFYASVEQRDDPRLRGKPVIVGGSPDKRGVVASCSYEARKYGVKSAMSSRRAIQLCPRAIFVPARFSHYREVSRKLRRIFHEVTDLVEPLSLDEAYLDVTGNKLGEPSATRLAHYLRARIRGQLQLTASAGVAPNKFLAKIASDLKKPDGCYVIAPDQVASFVEALPVEKLWGVGPVTASKLKVLGLPTTREIRHRSPEDLERYLGKFAYFLHRLAHGEDDRPVCPSRPTKSRGAETTFVEDIRDLRELETQLADLCRDVADTLAHKELEGRTVTLKVRYSDFTTVTRSRTFDAPLSSADALEEAARRLLPLTEAGSRPVRLLGVSVSNFTSPESPLQLSLLPDADGHDGAVGGEDSPEPPV